MPGHSSWALKNSFRPHRCSNSPGLPVFTLRLGKHQVRVARTVVCSVRPCITSCGLNMITVLFTWARPLRATPCVPASAGLAPGPSRRVHSPNIWRAREPANSTCAAAPSAPATSHRPTLSTTRTQRDPVAWDPGSGARPRARPRRRPQRRARARLTCARGKLRAGPAGRRPPCLGAREDDRKILAQSDAALATCRHLRIRPNTQGASRLWMTMDRVGSIYWVVDPTHKNRVSGF